MKESFELLLFPQAKKIAQCLQIWPDQINYHYIGNFYQSFKIIVFSSANYFLDQKVLFWRRFEI